MSYITYADVVGKPHDTCRALRLIMPSVVGSVVTDWSSAVVKLDLQLQPPLELQAHGYQVEQIRIVQRRDATQPVPEAFPSGSARSWLHRNPGADGSPGGALCLWYPEDPPRLCWDWSHGFERFVFLVQRHLETEELVRRGNPWPVEDAPHGHRLDGKPHPILCARR